MWDLGQAHCHQLQCGMIIFKNPIDSSGQKTALPSIEKRHKTSEIYFFAVNIILSNKILDVQG